MIGHHNLKEFFMVGFEGTDRQVYLVRFVIGVCSTALRHVAMYKKGHARDKGHWDWVTQQQHSEWTDEEKDNTMMQIMNGISSPAAASPVSLRLIIFVHVWLRSKFSAMRASFIMTSAVSVLCHAGD
jgi:hypothetical protein